MSEDTNALRKPLADVREEIAKACERAGRKPEDVCLIAVSKTKPVSMMRDAIACGQTVFGENKVQELCEKAEELADEDITLHLIGHLQKNKVRKAVAKAAMIHSVDSIELAAEIQKEAARIGKIQDILLEVNVAAEESKFGLTPDETAAVAEEISQMPNVHLCGLMTVAPYTEFPEENRVYFRQLRELAVDIESKKFNNIDMYCLSMGMSNDFTIAVEEGATFVRVGSRIFGERHYETEKGK
ncbi:MAG: YggS family pyridoxal phosphate-dependent enzyme [Lachnospiraceae bacterium]|nr:YggS family pyridoxal phosphate-dependent enzyme [Lachnospiraceae bacterium]